MNFIQKIIGGLLVTSSIALPVDATIERSRFEQYIRLAETIELTGTDFQLNPPQCNRESNTYGWYNGHDNQLVVCQEDAKFHNWNEVQWSEEDLDTLRHEAHHLVQDCMDNRLDGRLTVVYQDMPRMATQVLGYDKILKILDVYGDLSDHAQLMEIEAFAVADLNDPEEQIRDIHTYCLS